MIDEVLVCLCTDGLMHAATVESADEFDALCGQRVRYAARGSSDDEVCESCGRATLRWAEGGGTVQ